MGASAGGLTAFNRIIKKLPDDLNAAVFIVWHVSPYSRSMLPEILSRAGKLEVKHPADGESIQPGKIYVARPDRHLLLGAGRVRLTKGQKKIDSARRLTRCLGPLPTLMAPVSSESSSRVR